MQAITPYFITESIIIIIIIIINIFLKLHHFNTYLTKYTNTNLSQDKSIRIWLAVTYGQYKKKEKKMNKCRQLES